MKSDAFLFFFRWRVLFLVKYERSRRKPSVRAPLIYWKEHCQYTSIFLPPLHTYSRIHCDPLFLVQQRKCTINEFLTEQKRSYSTQHWGEVLLQIRDNKWIYKGKKNIYIYIFAIIYFFFLFSLFILKEQKGGGRQKDPHTAWQRPSLVILTIDSQ